MNQKPHEQTQLGITDKVDCNYRGQTTKDRVTAEIGPDMTADSSQLGGANLIVQSSQVCQREHLSFLNCQRMNGKEPAHPPQNVVILS